MRRLLISCFLLVAAMIFSAQAESAKTVLVLSSEKPEYKTVAAGFKKAFSGNYREINLKGSDEQQRLVGSELKASKPEVLVVVGNLAAQMAKWNMKGVPIVYCNSLGASKISLTSGKNIGIYHEPDPIEQLKIIRKAFPAKKRIGLLYSPEYTSIDTSAIKNAAQASGVKLEMVAMGSVKAVPGKLKTLLPNVDLLWVFTDPVVLSSHSNQYVVLQSILAKIPIFCGNNSLARAGATAALVPDLEDVGKSAAVQAQKVLGGDAPSKSAILYPGGKLVLNLKMASILKITFPKSLIGQAAEIIK